MKTLIAACASVLAASALAMQPADAIRDASYTLSEGASATIADDVTITLDKVADSRCPEGTMCVRKGGLAWTFTLRAGERVETFTLTDESPSFTPASVDGLRLSVDPGLPPAAPRRADMRQGETPAAPPPPATHVTVQVSGK
ncbi:MAG TPA: hypothetical protein VFT37_10655 [Telluria sp.]|nr:hypothetical protein [Telluria sp.]